MVVRDQAARDLADIGQFALVCVSFNLHCMAFCGVALITTSWEFIAAALSSEAERIADWMAG